MAAYKVKSPNGKEEIKFPLFGLFEILLNIEGVDRADVLPSGMAIFEAESRLKRGAAINYKGYVIRRVILE